jgi:hypothetical protein
MVAVVLLVLLAVEGVTILFLGELFSVHQFVGLLLLGPVLLKLASTGYRFVRYYAGDRAYRAKGPPILVLRLIAPVVVLSTLVVFGTGVALALKGPPGDLLTTLHKGSFIVWLGATGIHALAHLLRVPTLATADLQRGNDAGPVGGVYSRRLLLALALLAGLGFALAASDLARPWLKWVG